MTVDFYKTTDAPNVANKTLTDKKSVENVKPFNPCNIDEPSFLMDYDSTLNSYNYCYVSEFGKYYYVSPPTLETGHKMRINCTCDVLKTYYDDICNCVGMITRSESVGAPSEIPDTQLPVNPNNVELKTIPFRYKTGNSFRGNIANPFNLVWSGVGEDTPYLLQIRGVEISE